MTSAFKQAVQADISRVFINPGEFADEHLIDGHRVVAVVDSDVMQERGSRAATEYAEGVFVSEKRIYVAAEELPWSPVRGEQLNLDGDRYMVTDVAFNMGVLEITIQANES